MAILYVKINGGKRGGVEPMIAEEISKIAVKAIITC